MMYNSETNNLVVTRDSPSERVNLLVNSLNGELINRRLYPEEQKFDFIDLNDNIYYFSYHSNGTLIGRAKLSK
jgi:hypothetical protein